MKRRQKITDFINSDEFDPSSRPDRRTVIAAIKRGDIPGDSFMGQWWVFKDQIEQAPASTTGNHIADKILAQMGSR